VGWDFAPIQTSPGAHLAFCTMGIGSFPGVKFGWRMVLTNQPHLVPWSWKSRAIPLLTLWATTRPVMGTLHLLPLPFLNVHFIFFTYSHEYFLAVISVP